MLKSLHLCATHRWRVQRYRRFRFQPGLNLLIGPNGTGKSTILRAIASCPDCQRKEEGATEYVVFFSSHGEILQAAFSTLRMTSNTCLLFDEPEAGQDFDHLLQLRAAMDRAVAQGVQIIVATHEVLFWDRAHIIELRRGYRQRITQALCRMKCLKPENPAP